MSLEIEHRWILQRQIVLLFVTTDSESARDLATEILVEDEEPAHEHLAFAIVFQVRQSVDVAVTRVLGVVELSVKQRP